MEIASGILFGSLNSSYEGLGWFNCAIKLRTRKNSRKVTERQIDRVNRMRHRSKRANVECLLRNRGNDDFDSIALDMYVMCW